MADQLQPLAKDELKANLRKQGVSVSTLDAVADAQLELSGGSASHHYLGAYVLAFCMPAALVIIYVACAAAAVGLFLGASFLGVISAFILGGLMNFIPTAILGAIYVKIYQLYKIPSARLVAWGTSIGAGLAFYLANKVDDLGLVAAVLLAYGFASLLVVLLAARNN